MARADLDMVMRWLAIAALLGGCIEDALVPCGTASCPTGDMCVADRCVTPAQLAACTGLSEGTTCTLDHSPGKCSGGACVLTVCGNGVLDPGEVCDDGNVNSGDGCNATCTSTETCGNGIVDLEVGEGCDCGSAGNVSALCSGPNSADLTAQCGLDCKPRYCGDGIVDTIEQCDGSVPDTVTCASYGYYRGDVTCQACTFDVTGCSGRCGDGVIDTANGEYCDGTLPNDASCLTFGYDLGSLTCGNGCGADLASCFALSLAPIGPAIGGSGMWGGGGRIAVIGSGGAASVFDGTTWSTAPDSYSLVTGTATQVFAIGAQSAARWTPASGWVALTPPWAGTRNVSAAWASDTLGLFVGSTDDAVLDRFDGTTWTQLTGSWQSTEGFWPAHSFLWIHGNLGNYRYDGSSLTAFSPFSSTEYLDAEGGDGSLWAVNSSGVLHQVGGQWVTVSTQIPIRLEPAGDAMYMWNGFMEDAQIVRLAPAPLAIQPGIGGFYGFADDGTGQLYVSRPDALYALLRGQWRALGEQFTNTELALPGGPFVHQNQQTGNFEMLAADDTMVPLTMPASGCTQAGVTATGSVIAACSNLYVDGTQVASGSFDTLWASRDGSQIAAYGSGTFVWRTGGAWHSISVNRAYNIAGDSVDDLYATDAQDDLIHFDGTSWTTVIATNVGGPLVVTPMFVYYDNNAQGQQGAWMMSRIDGTTAPAPFQTAGYTYSGGVGEEMFAHQPALLRGSTLWRYAGGTKEQIRLPGGNSDYIRTFPVGENLVITGYDGQIYVLERTATW